MRKSNCMQVINEYKKARVLMADSAATNKSGVWQSLFHEVEKVSIPDRNAAPTGYILLHFQFS